MLYFVKTAMFFEESSLDELKSLSGFKIVDKELNNLMVDASSDIDKKMQKKDCTFIHSAFRIDTKGKISKDDYLGSLYKPVLKVIRGARIGKKDVIVLECYDINNKEGYSAKDVEVNLGKRLIKDGYTADLVDPSRRVYMILLNGNCYVGEERLGGSERKALDPTRRVAYKVSRAELKISQAFGEFDIKGNGVAIDLGAAPGGWSAYLAGKGYKVVAIDTADLDTASLSKMGIKSVKAGSKLKNLGKIISGSDVVHLKADSAEALIALRGMKADLLADDMNMDCVSSIKEALKYKKFLRKGGVLLMTIKCVTRNAPRYIKEARKLLAHSFEIKGIKVLPSNRQEMTLCAVYKGRWRKDNQ
jgi:predicted rRNA methylase YqxC with S4 and FtsJ domains